MMRNPDQFHDHTCCRRLAGSWGRTSALVQRTITAAHSSRFRSPRLLDPKIATRNDTFGRIGHCTHRVAGPWGGPETTLSAKTLIQLAQFAGPWGCARNDDHAETYNSWKIGNIDANAATRQRITVR